jgi:hypothetical protein
MPLDRRARCPTEEALLKMIMRYPFGLAMTCVANILVAEPRDYPVQVRPSVFDWPSMPQTLERHQYLWVGSGCTTEEAPLK